MRDMWMQLSGKYHICPPWDSMAQQRLMQNQSGELFRLCARACVCVCVCVCVCSLTRTRSISSLSSMKFHNFGLNSSHMPPRSRSTPSSWNVLLTWQTHIWDHTVIKTENVLLTKSRSDYSMTAIVLHVTLKQLALFSFLPTREHRAVIHILLTCSTLACYLLNNPLCRRGVWCVEDLPHQKWLQGLPDHTRDRTGLQTPHHIIAVRSWGKRVIEYC